MISFDVKNNQEGVLQISEQNQFRLMALLTQKFRAATDEQLKTYLGAKLLKER